MNMKLHEQEIKMDSQKAEVPLGPADVKTMAAVAAPSQKFRLRSYRGWPTLEIGSLGGAPKDIAVFM